MSRVRECADCKRTKKIQAHGLCMACYKRWRRQDPDYAQRDRESSQRWKGEHREANRARDRRHYRETKDPCPHCSTPKAPKNNQCEGCRMATADVRRTLCEGMWADGWPLKEIAAAMGVKPAYFAVMRLERGWDLPYRYKMVDGRRVAA